MRCYRGDFSAERFAEKKGNGRWGRGGRLEARGGGTVFFFRNRFRHSCRSLPGLNNEGAGGGRIFGGFSCLFRYSKFEDLLGWDGSLLDLLLISWEWEFELSVFMDFRYFFFRGKYLSRNFETVIFNLIIVPIICNVIFLVFFFYFLCY